jgi:hypothetical protein
MFDRVSLVILAEHYRPIAMLSVIGVGNETILQRCKQPAAALAFLRLHSELILTCFYRIPPESLER